MLIVKEHSNAPPLPSFPPCIAMNRETSTNVLSSFSISMPCLRRVRSVSNFQLNLRLSWALSHCTCWLYIFCTSALAAQGSDKRVTFAPEAKPSSAANLSVPDDWGFRFVVDPLHGVHYRVVRELELICRFGGRTRSGSASSTAGATFGPQVEISLASRSSGPPILCVCFAGDSVKRSRGKITCDSVLFLFCLSDSDSAHRQSLFGGPRHHRGGSASVTLRAEGCCHHQEPSLSEQMQPGVWSPSLQSSVWSIKTKLLASSFGGR